MAKTVEIDGKRFEVREALPAGAYPCNLCWFGSSGTDCPLIANRTPMCDKYAHDGIFAYFKKLIM